MNLFYLVKENRESGIHSDTFKLVLKLVLWEIQAEHSTHGIVLLKYLRDYREVEKSKIVAILRQVVNFIISNDVVKLFCFFGLVGA